jgi:UDP-N-acetylglucosamine 2-epimerase (non-hydrolysing)
MQTNIKYPQKKIFHVVGARPNFMKVAPVMAALNAFSHVEQRLVHTGQHYDANMSEIFFRQLELPPPDINLGVGSGTHAWQTAQIMMRFEQIIQEAAPDLVLVYGDVNSTVAAALVSAKLGIKIGHVEAGLRSFDRSMPEEINRLITDQISDLLFTPSVDGNENLVREGVDPSKIFFVGNVMIDTLVRLLPKAKERQVLKKVGLAPNDYGLVTLHRPSNVDDVHHLREIVSTLQEISLDIPLIFPAHPRTLQRLQAMGWMPKDSNRFRLLEPQSYLDFLSLLTQARFVITDSGGVQEESSFLGIPCLTLRENTERPITVSMGTNILVGRDMKALKENVKLILNGQEKTFEIPPLWDGHAAKRIAAIIT